MMTITREELPTLVREELTHLLTSVPAVQYELIGVMAQTFAQRTDLQAVLERIEAQGERIEALREDFNRQFAEHSRRMDEFSRRMDEFSRRMDELREDFNRGFAHLSGRMDRVESTLGALGARWGMMAESAFREGLIGVLRETGWQVKNYRKMDTHGVVFREPDQVEIDVVIHNGTHSLIEIKSSISRGDVEHFQRKVTFYEQEEGVKVKRMLIISPMFGPRARELAQSRGMETYTSAYDVPRP
jgi:hypothetical protein